MRSEHSASVTETIFDGEIARLENRRAVVEAERQKLLAGQITVTGPDGSSLMNINLGVLSTTASDQKTVERNLRQTLLENPLVPVLDSSFKKTRELREELAGIGELTAPARSSALFRRLMRANTRSNRAISSKSQQLGKVFASPWLLLAGLAIFLIWGGGPLLYAISGGTFGEKPLTAATAAPIPTLSPAPAGSVTPRNKEITSTVKATGAEVQNFKLNGKASPLAYPLNIQAQPQAQDGVITPTPNPSPTTAMVGNPPSSAGGLNGPHGAFLAPSRMAVPALGLDTPIERAISQDNSNGGEAVISWPRPGEVVQTGAYPGEIGNLLIMGNQKELGVLRRIQQNDEITLYDRKNNAFIYRALPFSADGQTEREVDPTSLEDAWVFSPSEQSILTILVTYPQPLPAVDPNQRSATNQVTPQDDYLVQKKLAYRAVLAMYAPARVTPAGTPVAVPDEAWQTVAAPSPKEVTTSPSPSPVQDQPTTVPPAQTALTIPGQQAQTTQDVVIPAGVPATGEGGGGGVSSTVKAGRYSRK